MALWTTFTGWIDRFPWWAVLAVSFAAGSLLGVYLKIKRRGKYDKHEPQGA